MSTRDTGIITGLLKLVSCIFCLPSQSARGLVFLLLLLIESVVNALKIISLETYSNSTMDKSDYF